MIAEKSLIDQETVLYNYYRYTLQLSTEVEINRSKANIRKIFHSNYVRQEEKKFNVTQTLSSTIYEKPKEIWGLLDRYLTVTMNE